MRAAEFLLIAGLVIFASLSGAPPFAWRRHSLWLAASLALAAGLWSIAHFDWRAAPGSGLAALFLISLALSDLLQSRTHTRARPLFGGGLAALAVVAASTFYFFPHVSLPAPGGAYAVGAIDFDLTDDTRLAVLDAPDDAPRRLKIRAWYPAEATSGLAQRPYFTDWEARVQAPSIADNWGLPSFALSHLRHARIHNMEGAPVAAADNSYPVIIYSHGYWGWAGQNTALMEELASRGYIVFSIGHAYDAAAIRFNDGEIIKTSPLKAASQTPDPAMVAFWTAKTHDARLAAFPAYRDAFDRHRVMQSHRAWIDDTVFVMETLRSGAVPEKTAFVARRADFDRLGIGGMSFGGQIAVSVCHRTPSCKAAVNLDGGEFDWELIDANVRMPVLMMQSDWVGYHEGEGAPDPEFHLNDYAYETFETAGLNGRVFRMRVKNIRHLGFTDLPLIARQPFRGKAFGSIGRKEAVTAINDFAGDFFDRYVREKENGFPDSANAKHPDVLPHDASAVREWRLANPEGIAP